MNKPLLFLCIISLCAALIGGSVACAPKAGGEIRVTHIASLTGANAGGGIADSWGAQVAVDDINELGGVNVGGTKMPIKLTVLNDESDADKKTTLTESAIVEGKTQFILSPFTPFSPGSFSIADRYKVPCIIPGGPYEPWLGLRQEVEGHWEYTWYIGFAIAMPPQPPDFGAGKPGYTVMDVWMEMLHRFGDETNKKVGLVAIDNPDGRGWYSIFGPALQGAGYDVIGFDKSLGLIPMETTDFSSAVKEWQNNDCQILWGNGLAPFLGTCLKQCSAMGFQPKMVCLSNGPQHYEEVVAWGGDLPLGVGVEVFWDPSFQDCPGFGDRTPMSLYEKWTEETGRALDLGIGPGYRAVQVVVDALERAGSTDAEAIQNALATTDLMTIGHRVKFNENHFCYGPVVLSQWFKTDSPKAWELKVSISSHDFAPASVEPLFPIPYQ